MTVSEIVEAAFRKIGLKAADEALTADQLAHGASALSMMLAAWRLEGVDIPVYSFAPGDVFPLPAEFREGAVFMLAARLSPDYMVPAGFNADAWLKSMQAYMLRIEPAEMPMALTHRTWFRYR